MDLPISRASAYLKRNQTTHLWYGDWSSAGCLMSQSCPSARTLEDHMRNARAAMSVSSSFYQPRTAGKSHSLPGALKAGNFRKGAHAAPSSSASSPGPTTSVKIPHGGRVRERNPLDKGRPSSAYSYDGGFFVTANNTNKDFFVINPEWVSEEDAIKKLPAGKSTTSAPKAPKVINWKSYKRSKSAPPSKHRHNPITWQE